METMRIDAADTVTILGIGLRVHMWLAIAMIVMGTLGMIFVLTRLRPLPDPGVYLKGREPQGEVAAATTQGASGSEKQTAGKPEGDRPGDGKPGDDKPETGGSGPGSQDK